MEERNWEKSEALHDVERGSLDRSRYFMQIENFLPCYAEPDLLMVSQEELRSDRKQTLRRVLAFLGVDPELTGGSFPSWSL